MTNDTIECFNSGSVTIESVYAGAPPQASPVSNDALLSWDLSIPDYQRQYSWKTKNAKDFLEGIALWQREKKYPYHAGTIVLNKTIGRDSESWDVIDGQQRLTTLAIYAFINNYPAAIPLLKKDGHFFKEEEIHSILRARNAIRDLVNNTEFVKQLDLSRIVFSVVKLSGTSSDLAYTFFSNNNSTGKRLTDYDLLKTHHLRYLSTNKEAEIFSKKWIAFEKLSHQDDLLQKMLFRLRKWNNKEWFAFESSGLDNYTVFNHFKSVDSLPGNLPCNRIPFRFNSRLSGGREFFSYVDYYSKKYEDFIQKESIIALENHLGWHSNGVICAGVKALSFFFYCKFGDFYLNEAVYLLVYQLSKLRNESQIRCKQLSDNPVFSEMTQLIDQVTSETQLFCVLSDVKSRYRKTNTGQTANWYWEDRNKLMSKLSKSPFAINKILD